MIIEYVGIADRQVGTGTIHEVRAWWNVRHDTEGRVKRAAIEAVREAKKTFNALSFDSWDMSTHDTPQINAMIRIRELSTAEVARRKELTSRRYNTCDGCGTNGPGQLVRMHADGTERALCYQCWNPVKSTCKVLHWIDKHGKLQVN